MPNLTETTTHRLNVRALSAALEGGAVIAFRMMTGPDAGLSAVLEGREALQNLGSLNVYAIAVARLLADGTTDLEGPDGIMRATLIPGDDPFTDAERAAYIAGRNPR